MVWNLLVTPFPAFHFLFPCLDVVTGASLSLNALRSFQIRVWLPSITALVSHGMINQYLEAFQTSLIPSLNCQKLLEISKVQVKVRNMAVTCTTPKCKCYPHNQHFSTYLSLLLSSLGATLTQKKYNKKCAQLA